MNTGNDEYIISYKSEGLSTLVSVDILDSFKNILFDIVLYKYFKLL